ncbi:hypothetical protein SDC9_79940 [bioreactor metagenome]|uniref:Uncharacterized protein n=1 Tax=bioreactor metagenome TaxID=1076179 RepID=A0A644YXU9_9ZZZZ
MLPQAENVGAAEHNHPHKQVLGQGLGNSAGLIEAVTGNDLVGHEDGHKTQNDDTAPLHDFIDAAFDGRKHLHKKGSLSFIMNRIVNAIRINGNKLRPL